MDKNGTDLFRDILSGRSQSLDTDLFPIEFHQVRVGETPSRNFPLFGKCFTLNDVGPWQNPTVAAGTLESA